jgi:hypothetical protein
LLKGLLAGGGIDYIHIRRIGAETVGKLLLRELLEAIVGHGQPRDLGELANETVRHLTVSSILVAMR